MPIFINGDPLKNPVANLRNLNSFLKVYGSYFQQGADKLKEAPHRIVTLKDAVLYISQREFAVLRDDCSSIIDKLGSDMATTCHLVVLRCPNTKVTALGHFDGVATSQGVNDLIDATLEEISHVVMPGAETVELDLHIVGGFSDSRKLSEDLSEELLNEFSSYRTKKSHSNVKMNLRTFCTTSLNNVRVVKKTLGRPVSSDVAGATIIDSPAILGIVVDIKTGELCRATFEENAREPILDLRGSRSMNGVKCMINIYRPRENFFIVEPFTYKQWEDIEMWLHQPGHIIRRYMSTSPDVEPNNFEKYICQILQFIHANPDPMTTVFQSSKPIVFEPVVTDEGLLWNRRNP